MGFCLVRAPFLARSTLASWQSGYAPDCKSVYSGSIPLEASKQTPDFSGVFLCLPFGGAIQDPLIPR